MAGISSKALSFGDPGNKFKFNGGTEFSGGEFLDGSGLDLYETPFRGFDKQIGRFWQIDAMADAYENWSVYNFSLNAPILFNDPTGLKPDCEDCPTGKLAEEKSMEAAVVKSSYKNKWKASKWSHFADVNKNQDFVELHKNLRNQGVDDNGLKLFSQAWSTIGYRERLQEYDEQFGGFVEDALFEAALWYGGGQVVRIGGKLFKLGYRAYKLNRLQRAERGANFLYHYTTEAGAKSIMESGLTISEKRPFVYLTNNGTLSPLQAQIELALPANRALPSSILKVNVSRLDPALIRRVTGNLPGFGAGGGTEFLFNKSIPSNLIQIIK